MKHLKVGLLLTLACFLGNTFAITLLSDNFQDSATSTKTYWIFPTALQTQFKSGALFVQNTNSASDSYEWYISHSFASPAQTFTVSVTVASDSIGAGLLFCKKGNDGITLQVGTNQTLYAWKSTNSQDTIVFNVTNSFISKTSNTISISKRDSTFNVFCNSVYMGSFFCSDAEFINGGDIAMIVPPKAHVQFNNFLMTDQYQSGSPVTTFSDNFSSGNLLGWNFGQLNGSAVVASGALTVTNNDLVYPANPYINGDFNRASLKVIATHKKGDGFYGLAFYELAPGPLGDSIKPYLFLINTSRSWASGNPDTRLIYATQTTLVHGDTDTLEVLRFSNKYKFSINGALMPDSFPLLAPGKIGAAGLYVDTDAVVSFEDFRIGGDSTGFTTGVIFSKPNKTITAMNARFYSGDRYVFDLRGRTVKRLGGNSLEALKGVGAGMYIVRPIENMMVAAKKSVTVLK